MTRRDRQGTFDCFFIPGEKRGDELLVKIRRALLAARGEVIMTSARRCGDVDLPTRMIMIAPEWHVLGKGWIRCEVRGVFAESMVTLVNACSKTMLPTDQALRFMLDWECVQALDSTYLVGGSSALHRLVEQTIALHACPRRRA